MTTEQGSAGNETIPHGVPLPDDPEHVEFVHPEAQGFVALLFGAMAVLFLALAPIATRAAPMQKGWWVEPITWPIFTLTITLVAAAWQVAGWVKAARTAPDKGEFAARSLWALGALGPALEYSAYFCVYLVAVEWLGFALSSFVFLQFVVWRAGLRSWAWKLKAAAFVVIVVLAFRVGIDLWFPLAPLYERFFPDWFVQSIAIYL
jgi:hypothetical protein